MLRTHTCGELSEKHIGEKVTLCGWVDTRRDHGNLIFIDLRDRWGKTQLVFNSESSRELHEAGENLRSEFVCSVSGVVQNRPAGTVNPKIPTGTIEIFVEHLKILNTSEALPFELLEGAGVSEDIRLKYRFLDLRRPEMQTRLVNRHRVAQAVREYLDGLKFVEVETPMLTKSTPEGARDFLVPSRLNMGSFYALPQSPQLFKQILMVSGFDRYFQFARCFRDEDLRADRQLEHTQIDLEMSFVSEEDIQNVVEGLVERVMKEIAGVQVSLPFRRLGYQDAMNRFGCDKPDLRFEMEIRDATDIFKASEFKVFRSVAETGGSIKGLCVSGKSFSRSEFDELTKMAQGLGAKGLAWFKVSGNTVESPIAKFLVADQQKKLIDVFGASDQDTLFLVADEWSVACTVLGTLRNYFGDLLGLRKDSKSFQFLWVVDFPMFQWNEEEKRFDALHHPFTSPQERDLDLLESEPAKVRARAYDLVLNGTEIGGGSIRIHREDVQKRVFHMLKIDDKEAEEKFGFLLAALRFGAPPHGGLALGLDRLCAMLFGVDSIREVIAFPKTQKGACLMTNAPSPVYPKQLKELHIQVKN